MIEGKDICKNFDGFMALDHMNFSVKKGTVYGLVGPNGAGKSTLLRHITGIFKASSGSVLFEGEDVYENVSAKSRMTFIPDDVFYLKNANIMDMKKFYKGIYDTFSDEIFDEMLHYFSSVDKKKKIRNMSKGMQKQAAFMLAISINPEVLVLDEPVDGLDPVIRHQVWKILLAKVSENQMTVIVSSHNLRELEDVCDYVGIMHKGKMLLEGAVSDLQQSVTKVQIAFKGDFPDLSDCCEILHKSTLGRMRTLIIRGDSEEVREKLAQKDPMILDILPLTLEEIFIYELGGENYEIKEILY